MCDHHPGDGRNANLLIAIQGPDGTVHTRTWQVCPASIEQFAASLGRPKHETIASPEAQQAVAAAVRGTPGVVLGGGQS
jgi:hypothetical protein